jgi:UDP-N-acetylenolpyruvoylglucosamine reductase
MLANKYLKYRPEITLEIFTLVWNKLFANGWYNTECDNCDREYDEFSGKYPILKDQENKDFYSEEASEQIKKLTETTVQEILGYNPFEDDFKLERNWQIKTTNEVIEELQKHDILYEVNYSYTPNAYYGMNNGYKFGQIGVKQNVQMITLEQLKQYVLKTTEQPKVMETKVESKPIEKWSVGSYIVFLQDEVLTRSGKVTKGKPYVLTTGGYIPYFTDDNSFTINFNSKKYESYGLQWFATLQEAEMFAKTLVEPVKEEVKQPLKQAVHCKTLEEYKFLKQKISIFRENVYSKSNDTVKLDKPNSTWNLDECKDDGYQILSFQEWCQQNGYVMKNKSEDEVKQIFNLIVSARETVVNAIATEKLLNAEKVELFGK